MLIHIYLITLGFLKSSPYFVQHSTAVLFIETGKKRKKIHA